jgi:hypothetical protein
MPTIWVLAADSAQARLFVVAAAPEKSALPRVRNFPLGERMEAPGT